jgi:broad specificity phosphatase PhoE
LVESATACARVIGAQALGLDVLEDVRLDEIDCGSWTGQRWGDLRNDARWGAYAGDPDGFTLPDGESYDALRQRIGSFACELDHTRGSVVIVSHLDTLRMFVAVMSSVMFRATREWIWNTGEALEATLPTGIPLRDLEGVLRARPSGDDQAA